MNKIIKQITKHSTWLLVSAVFIAYFLGYFSEFGLKESSQVAATILVIAAMLWITEVVPLFVTSFIILFLGLTVFIPLESSTLTNSDLLAPFFADIILLFFGSFVLCLALQKYGLDEQFGKMTIYRSEKSFKMFLLTVMLTTAFLSMWLSNTATAAMMIGLCMPIIYTIPQTDPHRKALVLGIPFSANIGGLGTPIGSPPNAIAMEYLTYHNTPVSFLQWMLIAVPLTFIILIFTWYLLLKLFKGETLSITPKAASQFKPSNKSFIVIACSFLTVLGWMFGNFLNLSPGTVSLIPIIAFFSFKILDKNDLRLISWDVLFMMGGGLCLGRIIEGSALTTDLLAATSLNSLSLYAVVVSFSLIACLISCVMSNTTSANVIMPLVASLPGISLLPVLISVAFACTLAMPLPISTPPNAIAYSTGEVASKDFILAGSIITALSIFLVLTLGYLVMSYLFI